MDLIAKYGFYVSMIFLLLTIFASQSGRDWIRKCQYVLLLIFIIGSSFSLYSAQKKTNTTSSGIEIQKPTPAKPPVVKPDIPPAFLDAMIINELDIPIFSGPQQHQVLLSVFFPASMQLAAKIGQVDRCYMDAQADISLTSDRITITPKNLVCRNLSGREFRTPVSGFILDLDGKLGVQGETVQEAAKNRSETGKITGEMEEAAKLLGVSFEEKSGSKKYPKSPHLVVNGQKPVTLVLIEGVKF